MPRIFSKLHNGHTTHVGKIPVSFNERFALKKKIEEIRLKMQEAIETERFEDAAALRDEANALKERLAECGDGGEEAMSINKFMKGAVTGWMTSHGEHSDIVMSTRIRLARNLRGCRFPIAFTAEEAQKSRRASCPAALLTSDEKGYAYMKMSELAGCLNGKCSSRSIWSVRN